MRMRGGRVILCSKGSGFGAGILGHLSFAALVSGFGVCIIPLVLHAFERA
jgi:hypothetical protein